MTFAATLRQLLCHIATRNRFKAEIQAFVETDIILMDVKM